MTQLPTHAFWRLVAGEDGQYNDLQFKALRNAGFLRSNQDMLAAWLKGSNKIPNSSASGAAVDGNVLPDTWTGATSPSPGLTREVVGLGFESSLPYVDIRLHGTTVGAANSTVIVQFLHLDEAPSASIGDTWTTSGYFSIVDGSIPAGVDIRLQITFRTSTNSFLTSNVAIMANGDLSNELQLQSTTLEAAHADTAKVDSSLRLVAPDATAIDFTFRVVGIQLEERLETSPPILTRP